MQSPYNFNTSSNCSVSYNDFVLNYSATESLIEITNTGGVQARGVIINGNTAVATLGGTFTFVTIGASGVSTIIKDNFVTNFTTFLTDSGSGTKSATLGNFLNGTEQ